MADLTKTIEALLRLYQAIGPWWAVALLVCVIVMSHVRSQAREKKTMAGYREALNAKENEIQRIAEDNRQWRHFFFKQQGLSDEDILKLSGPSAMARPLILPEDEPPRGPHRPEGHRAKTKGVKP